MPSIVESVSKRLNRPDARARLADLAGVTPAAARKAIAPSSRAVIGALARAADQEGGARPVADLVAAVGSIHADDLIDRLANTSPYGDELVTALFGDERERVISVIGGKKAPDSDAGGILLGQLAPVVVSMVAERQAADGLDADALAVMIGEEAARSSGAGSAKLGVPALAGIVGVTGAAAAARTDMPPAADGVVTEDLPADAAAAVGTSPSSSSPSVGTAAAAAAAGAAAAASVAAGADSARVAEGAEGIAAEGADGADGAEDTAVAAAATGAVAAAAAGASLPSPPPRVVPDTGRAPVVIDEDRGLLRSPLVALTGVVALAVAVAWLLTQVTTESVDTATSTSGRSGAAEQVAGPVADEEADDADAADPAPEPEGPTETDGVAPSGESDDGAADDGASDDGASDDGAGSEGADGDADGGTAATETDADGAADAADEVDDADLVGRVARAVTATGVGDGVAVTSVNGEVTLGGSAADAAASQAIEDAVAAVDGVVSVTNDIRLIDDGAADEAAASADDAGAAADDGASTASDDSDGSDGADDGDKGEGSLNALLGLDTIRFEYYSEDLSSSGRSELDQVVGYLDDNADVSLEIQGHTDAIGAASLNQRLGQRRADAVRAYLIEAGIDGDRLTAVGIGEVDPVASNDTEAGREANRRIEFVIG